MHLLDRKIRDLDFLLIIYLYSVGALTNDIFEPIVFPFNQNPLRLTDFFLLID